MCDYVHCSNYEQNEPHLRNYGQALQVGSKQLCICCMRAHIAELEAEQDALKGDKKAIGEKLHKAKRKAEKAEIRERSAKNKVLELTKENQKLRKSLELHKEINKLKAELVLTVQEKKWAEAERDALKCCGNCWYMRVKTGTIKCSHPKLHDRAPMLLDDVFPCLGWTPRKLEKESE